MPYTLDDEPRSGGYFNTWSYTHEPLYSFQWGIRATNLDNLWAADNNNNSDRAIIAILDTGVDIEHTDLAANIWTNPDETANGYDDDGNGLKDDIHGWDFVNKTGNISDFNSHGTHCAGIAAAVGDNGKGITGANPKALIMPVTVMQSNGTGDVATIIQGINYAKSKGADVISMSFGSYAYSIALEQALAQAYQTTVLVAAAGNDGAEIDKRCNPFSPGPMFPAAFTFVLGVQATQQVPGFCGYRTCWSNYDCDGPSFSQFGEEQLYNYELSAPGNVIYSTVPGGLYRAMNGTSMACPLVAGGISALLHAKPYASQEMLFGDLINTTSEFHHVDFYACYNAGEAPAQLQMVTFETNDTLAGDGDMRPDAGELIEFYPTLRTTWGAADDITIWIEYDTYENDTLLDFADNNVSFGRSLSAYAKAKSLNPIRFTVKDGVVDGRNINLVLCASSPNAEATLRSHFSIAVENGVELGGMITEDITLYPNMHYIVTSSLVVPQNVTFTIKPGTVVQFKDRTGFVCAGHLIANGTPDSLIVFTKTDFGGGKIHNFELQDTIRYAVFDGLRFIADGLNQNIQYGFNGMFENCIIKNSSGSSYVIEARSYGYYSNCNIFNLYARCGIFTYGTKPLFNNCNFINNRQPSSSPECFLQLERINNSNSYNNLLGSVENYFSGFCDIGIDVFVSDHPSYFGSASHEILHKSIIDLYNPYITGLTYSVVDLDSVLHQPSAEAHGIVWKVVVNGYDAQDEFEMLPPLGVGRHQFDVYFNRAMDTLVTPFVSMGVRPPYTQIAIDKDGRWSEDGTIYTVYLDLDASAVTDGLNRIYVANAKDDEHFEIPYENLRFNVEVAVAGSMSTGFEATAGLGKIDLEWNDNEQQFGDFMGYNMYRYQRDSLGVSTDTLMLNTALINDTVFTDYDVVPGERYYYYYKVMRTNMSENDPSKVVSSVPLTSIRGDANGNFTVDVTDIVSVIAYISNNNPQPFIYDAADVNYDGTINVLDIVGIINIILYPDNAEAKGVTASAVYTVEDGYLFVDTPVELGGMQFVLGSDNVSATSVLSSFEQVSKQLNETNYLFMAYSMSGKTIPAGRHALMRIGDADIHEIVLSDAEGGKVLAIEGNANVIGENEISQMSQPYPNPFNGSISIPYIIGCDSEVEIVITDITGRCIDKIVMGRQVMGEYEYVWSPKSGVQNGIYCISLNIDGRNVHYSKVVYIK